jgi:hypothetical protein
MTNCWRLRQKVYGCASESWILRAANAKSSDTKKNAVFELRSLIFMLTKAYFSS